jgi:hypothetical protein
VASDACRIALLRWIKAKIESAIATTATATAAAACARRRRVAA